MILYKLVTTKSNLKLIVYPLHEDMYVSGSLINNGIWEVEVSDWIIRNLKPNMTFIDIGCHLGYFTTLASFMLNNTGRVISLDIDKEHVILTSINCLLNNLQNVDIHHAGILDEIKEQTFNLCHHQKGDNRVYVDEKTFQTWRHWTTGEKVNFITLDHLMKIYNYKVDIIKMDIQGTEYHALKGMPKIFENNPNLKIVMEVEPESLLSAGASTEKIYDLISKYGFKIYSFSYQEIKREDFINYSHGIYGANVIIQK